jgi:eukaryotic-like serine/threonine-protein kinase
MGAGRCSVIMTPELWVELKKLYHELVDLDAEERERRLAAIPDQALRNEAISLIQAGSLRSSFAAGLQEERERILAQFDAVMAPVENMAIALNSGAGLRTFNSGDMLASRYEIVDFLGQGGMGEVYEAEDRDLGERIAIKVIRPEAWDKAWPERFRREVQLSRRVTHSNVCRVFDIERHQQEERENIFLTMELVRGETLAARLKQGGRMSVSEALPIALQLCSALDAAHQADILHRDFKCGNVMLDGSGEQIRAVVTDFGTARLMASASGSMHTATGGIAGTPVYMSPEQLEGKELTPASDIYSLGLVLYEMVTGLRPFRAESTWAEAMKRLKDDPEPPISVAPEIGEDWNSTILRSLERDPDRRFCSAQQVAESLRGVAGANGLRINVSSGVAGAIREVSFSPGPGPAGSTKASEARAARRRHTWKLIIPIVVCVPMLTAWLWRWLPFSSQGSPSAGASRLLAVVEIENLTGDRSLDGLDKGVLELVTSNLAQSKSLGVISTERIRGLIRRRVEDEGHLPASQAQEVAKEAQADLFASGALLKIGSRLRLDLRVQDTASGRVLFAEKVEAENAQAIFAPVDRTTADILALLAPGETTAQPKGSASVTNNIEALRAYEEGVDYTDRWLLDRAEPALRRAIELDPQFTMAHYQLAKNLRFRGDLAMARQEGARAAELAEQLPVPRQQKLLIEAAQMFDDGRLQNAIDICKAAIREFPREPEPRLLLAVALGKEWKFEESAQVLEELLDFDRQNAAAYNLLGIAYVQLGDLPKALHAVDKYAALSPANDPNCIDTRGDVFSISGRFEEAVAEYKKNLGLNPNFIFYPDVKIAVAYLAEGKYRLAEIISRRALQRDNQEAKAFATGVLGDIEAAQGRLDQAAAKYEEAARLSPQGKDRDPSFAFERKAVEVYFEQGEPEQALALALHMPAPWAAGFRGTAYLLLKNDVAAEREFASLRGSLAPLFGDRGADNFLILFRTLAALYARRWQEVIMRGSQMDDFYRSRLVPALGRAYVEMKDWDNGERYLLRVAAMQRMSTRFGRDNGLAYALSKFYLAEVFKHAGKKADAIRAYREFLNHFENSNARLPQIAQARAALKRLM